MTVESIGQPERFPNLPSLYLSPYLVNAPPSARFEQCADDSARELWEAIRMGELYDLGDDPSFFAAEKAGGPVTCGVCRPTLRSTLAVGDVVAFFAVDRRKPRTTIEYFFVAAYTVADKVSHDSIHNGQELANFRSYFNLLIRPKSGGWERSEPSLRRRHWHDDWLWRMISHEHPQSVVEEASRKHRAGRALKVEGAPVKFDGNYVIFSDAPERSVVPSAPVPVATRNPPEVHECWLDSDVATSIRRLTLDKVNAGQGEPRFLRTSNPWFPHPHARVEMPDSSAWIKELQAALSLREATRARRRRAR